MLWRKNHLEENEDIYSDSSVYSDINYGEEKERTGRRGKKKGLKRAGAIVLSAVLFGAVAAGTFQGVNYLTGYGSGDDSQQEVKLIRAASTAGTANETAGGMDVTGIVEEAMPFVVSITNRSVQEVLNYYNSYGYGFMLPQTEETESCGSGIIIGQNDTELLIATNNHVVEDADDLSVSFIDNSVCEANIKGTDADNDLAVIAVPLDSISSL